MRVFFRELNMNWWKIEGSDLERPNLCNTESTFFLIDPVTINTLGGTKDSSLTKNQIDDNLKYITSDTFSVTAANFSNENWEANDWTPGDVNEIKDWVLANFGNNDINPGLPDMSVCITKGMKEGVEYTVVFTFLGNAGVETGPDAYTTLLLPFDGNLYDYSSYYNERFLLSGVVNFDTGVFDQAAWNNNAGFGYTLSGAPGSRMDFEDEDFTIDFWWKPDEPGQAQGLVNHGSSWLIHRGNFNTTLGAQVYTSNGTADIPLVSSFTVGAWHHIALVREDSTLRLFVNGIQVGSTSISGTVNYNAGEVLNLYPVQKTFYDEFRISKGIARWTSNFTPPLEPYSATAKFSTQDENTSLLLHLDGDLFDSSEYWIQEGASGITYDTGKFGQAAVFSGSGAITISPAGNQFDFGTGPFTFECWFNSDGTSGNQYLFGINHNGTPLVPYWRICISGGSSGSIIIAFYENGGFHLADINTSTVSSSVYNANEWNHLAVVRDNSAQYYVFVNGVSQDLIAGGVGSGLSLNMGSGGYPLYGGLVGSSIGDQTGFGAAPFNGMIDEVRISTVARWTSNFTPPVSPY